MNTQLRMRHCFGILYWFYESISEKFFSKTSTKNLYGKRLLGFYDLFLHNAIIILKTIVTITYT